MSEGPLFWILFNLFVALMLVLDLGVFHRNQRVMRLREALAWTAMWVALAAAFAGLVYGWRGGTKAIEFVTGYLIEESLSVDNLFVFLVLFSYFKVPRRHQYKVLFWGIIGALISRGVFIFTGVALINAFHWITYLFGAFLIYTGLKLLRKEQASDPQKSWIVRAVGRRLPVSSTYVDGKFFAHEGGRRVATPLLLVLLVVEATDVLFAADSIPAVIAITKDPFIVYTSNVFAILGLRSLYFAIAGLMEALRYLHYGLAAILVFIGVKMLLPERYQIPTPIALGVVVLVLATVVIASLLNRQRTGTVSPLADAEQNGSEE
jgi:tellurite resistance protein TerC